MRLVWTELALGDLSSARAWIAADRPAAAKGQIGRILTAAAMLPSFPDSGRPGRRLGTRELVVPRTPFVIAYRARDDVVEILRVLHGARRWSDRI